MFIQRFLHDTDDAQDAGNDAEAENAQYGKIGQVEVQELLDGVDDGHVQPENQQHGRTRNTG